MSQRTIGSRGPADTYEDFAKQSVAMRFPNGRQFNQADYPDGNFWYFLVLAQKKDRESQARFVMANSEEGQAILDGGGAEEYTQESLLRLNQDALQNLAEKFKVKTTSKNPKALAAGILMRQAEGYKIKDTAPSGV
jgi:hypothetical protein